MIRPVRFGLRRNRATWVAIAAAGAAALSGSLLASLPRLGLATAAAAECGGADKRPREIGAKKASRLVVCLVNRQRRAHGRKELKRRRGLVKAARRHTERMQSAGCFAHTCPGEPPLPERLVRSGYLPCGCRWEARENIAWGKKRRGSPRAVVRRWMTTKPHRRNLLRRGFRHVGVGVGWGSPYKRGARAGTYTINLGRKG